MEIYELLKVIYMSFFSIITLFILTKLMGVREVSQLSMFDYINGITIGSIAAEMATSLDDNVFEAFIAMVIYALVIILFSIISNKSIFFRRIINGKSKILFKDGLLYKENFKKTRIEINEFLVQCRTNGYFNLSDIKMAILEPNGKISFLPYSNKRPATPEDMNITVNDENILYNIIVDGKVLIGNLKATGHDLNWLDKQIKNQKIYDISNIFLATCDENNNLSIYTNYTKKNDRSCFE